MPINVVSEMLGHADSATTMHVYGHILPRGTADAAKAMAAMMAEAMAEEGDSNPVSRTLAEE